MEYNFTYQPCQVRPQKNMIWPVAFLWIAKQKWNLTWCCQKLYINCIKHVPISLYEILFVDN